MGRLACLLEGDNILIIRNIFFYSLFFIYFFSFAFRVEGSGLLVPTKSAKKEVNEASLDWYSILSSLNIEKEQDKLKQRWADYFKKLSQYAQLHPEIDSSILDEMKRCHVVIGMSEEQVLFMAVPSNIDNKIDSNEKILFYQRNLNRENTWMRSWVTIVNDKVIKIEEQDSSYGW